MKFYFKLHLNKLQHAKYAKALFERQQSSSPVEFPSRASFLLGTHDALHHPGQQKNTVITHVLQATDAEVNEENLLKHLKHLNQRPQISSKPFLEDFNFGGNDRKTSAGWLGACKAPAKSRTSSPQKPVHSIS